MNDLQPSTLTAILEGILERRISDYKLMYPSGTAYYGKSSATEARAFYLIDSEETIFFRVTQYEDGRTIGVKEYRQTGKWETKYTTPISHDEAIYVLAVDTKDFLRKKN